MFLIQFNIYLRATYLCLYSVCVSTDGLGNETMDRSKEEMNQLWRFNDDS